jgi:hypothetical protein
MLSGGFVYLSTGRGLERVSTLPTSHTAAFLEQHRTCLISLVTTPERLAARRTLTREQCVAALLVGAVVVLLGFASGLGLEPASSIPSAATPTVSTDGGAPPMTSETPPATSVPVAIAPPIAYVIEPAAPGSATAVSSAAASTPEPTVPPGTSPASPAPTSAPTAPSCGPGLLTALLEALLPNQGATDAGGLLGLGALLNSLSNVATGLSALLALDPTQLLGQVTDTLATPGLVPSSTSSADLAGLAGSCTTAVGAALPLLADGATIATSVAAVEST